MTRAILLTVISIISFVFSAGFIVRRLVYFSPLFEEKLESLAGLDQEEFEIKKKHFAWGYFDWRTALIPTIGLAITIACSLLDGIYMPDGLVADWVIVAAFCFFVPCCVGLFVYFRLIQKKFGLRYKFWSKYDSPLTSYAFLYAFLFSVHLLINLESLYLLFMFF